MFRSVGCTASCPVTLQGSVPLSVGQLHRLCLLLADIVLVACCCNCTLQWRQSADKGKVSALCGIVEFAAATRPNLAAFAHRYSGSHLAHILKLWRFPLVVVMGKQLSLRARRQDRLVHWQLLLASHATQRCAKSHRQQHCLQCHFWSHNIRDTAVATTTLHSM